MSDRYAAYQRLRIERREHGVLLLTLSNPGKLNATDARLHAELATIFADVHHDPEVRAVVVTGEGRAFSAGGDLDWIAHQVGNHAQTMQVMREAGDIVRTMIECDTPIISAINGVAVGAGLAVALLADISIIDQDTRFTDGHIRLGVAAGDVLPTALGIAEKLAAGPVDATRMTKRALNHWMRQALPNFEASLAYEMLNFLGADAAEGLASVREKRAPEFGRGE